MSFHKLLMAVLMVAASCTLADDGGKGDIVVWDNSFSVEGPFAGYKNYSQDFGDPPDIVGMVAADVDLPFGTVVTGGRLRFSFSAAGGVPDGIIFFVWEEIDGRLSDKPVARFDASRDFQICRDDIGLIIEGRFDGGQVYISSGEKLWWTILPVLDFPPQIFAVTTEEVVGEGMWATFLPQNLLFPWTCCEVELLQDIDVKFQLFGGPGPANGDIDSDDDVDLIDVELFFACVTGPGGGPLPGGCVGFDFDADDDVDRADFRGLQLRYTGPCGFSITQQPLHVTACPGDEFQLQVGVDADHVSFQWRRDGENIEGETTSVLEIPDASAADAASYDCVVTDNCGDVLILNVANVAVLEDVVLLTPPEGGTFCAGANFTLFVVADEVDEYLWFHDGVSISGATGTALTVTNIDADDAGAYQVLITGDCGSLLSPVADVVVSDCR